MDSYYNDDSNDCMFILILNGFHKNDSHKIDLKKLSVWRSAAPSDDQKIEKTKTNRTKEVRQNCVLHVTTKLFLASNTTVSLNNIVLPLQKYQNRV